MWKDYSKALILFKKLSFKGIKVVSKANLDSAFSQVFHVPLEERKYKDLNQFGEGDQAKVCVDIMHKTGAHLELSMAKDQGLSIMVSGKLDAVMKARKEIVSRLQTQVCVIVRNGLCGVCLFFKASLALFVVSACWRTHVLAQNKCPQSSKIVFTHQEKKSQAENAQVLFSVIFNSSPFVVSVGHLNHQHETNC